MSDFAFQAIVDHIRDLPTGRIDLSFQSGHASPIVAVDTVTFTKDASGVAGLEKELERER